MNKRKILIIVAILFILIGTILLCFPSASNYIYEKNVETEKEKFVVKITDEQNENILDKLYKKFELCFAENEKYQYGIDNNVIGYISIPKINIEVPILLGANTANMKKGAVHLTETSYPIGGVNTNSVIAAHRGYGKATLFRYIDKIGVGDKIRIRNFKEELTYEVYETKIINPDDISELEIQEGQDIITLITCHPYRINTQRYIVKAKRV